MSGAETPAAVTAGAPALPIAKPSEPLSQPSERPALSDSLQLFVDNLRGRGVPVDADLLHELQRNLKSWTNVLRKQRGLGSTIYSVPHAAVHWGEKQHAHHVNWADLFFDLTFVASAFRLGLLLEDVIELHFAQSASAADLFAGGFLFTAIFVCVRSVWESKLQYSSRFVSEDLAHKIFDLGEATLTAVLALNIPTTLADALDYTKTLLIFACVRLTLFAMNGTRWAEIKFFSKRRSSRLTGAYFLIEALVNGGIIAVSIVVIACNQAVWSIALLWLLSDSYFVVDIFRALSNRWNTKDNTTPLHVEAVVIREGEFIMLMIGEGVLGIVLAPVGADLPLHYQMFVTAFLILATLQVLHYSSQPAFAEGHALFRSRFRGVLWLKLQAIESGLVVVIGVALKMLIKLGTSADELQFWIVQWLLSIALATTHLLLQLFQIMHAGIVEELDVPWCARAIKLLLYLFKFVVAVSFVPLPLAHAEAFPFLIGNLFIGIVASIIQRIWDGLDRFIAHASAMAEEDPEMQDDRVVEIFDDNEDNLNHSEGEHTEQRPRRRGESILFQLLPDRLRNRRVEAELKSLHKMYGSMELQSALSRAASNLRKMAPRSRHKMEV